MDITYLRTSTEEQNPENQLTDCKRLIKTLGLDEFTLLQEQQSAWKDDKERPNWEKILSLIKKGQVNNLIVWDLDRIYRNRKKLVNFFKLTKTYKCHVHSYRQEWLNDLNKIPEPWNEIVLDFMIQIMGWMAEDESNKKSKRVKMAIRKVDGITKSYKGNKWGRKSISQGAINKLIELKKQEPKITIRELAERSSYIDNNNNRKSFSKSKVHTILRENDLI